MKRRLLALLPWVAAAGFAPTVLGQGTITDAPATFVRGPSPWDSSPDASITGVSTPTTQDHLFEAGWAFRVGDVTAENFFPAPATQTYTGDTSTVTWTGLAGGTVNATEVSVVDNTDLGAGPQGYVIQTMTITNTSAGPIDFRLFHMADFDVQPTAGNDRASLLLRQNHIRITDAAATNVAEYRGVGARAYMVRPFGATDLGTVLSNGAVDNLDNSGLPFGGGAGGDFTGAFQWNATIAAGASRSFTVLMSVNLSQVKGDFNDDTKTDLVLRNSVFTRHVLWTMDGLTRTAGIFFTPDVSNTDQRVVCTDDFNNDQRSDLLFWNQTDGTLEVWTMGGPTGSDRQAAVPVVPTGGFLSTDWKVAACGDANYDGRADILFRNSVTQKLQFWTMNGPNQTGTLVPTPDQAVDGNWIVVELTDYDADGFMDILWYNETSGRIVEWFMDRTVTRIFANFTTPNAAGDANWKVVASGEYGLGGRDSTPPTTTVGANDIIWRNDTSGRIVGWIMDGLSVNPTAANTRLQGLFTCPTAVGGTCNPADPPPPGATSWFIVGPK